MELIGDRARRVRLNPAVRMFQSGELSAGAAAEFAEVDRLTFAVECQRHGIPLVDYPAEDLLAELAALRGLGTEPGGRL
jgi:predicted HTH domain antitoxin